MINKLLSLKNESYNKYYNYVFKLPIPICLYIICFKLLKSNLKVNKNLRIVTSR